MIAREAQPEASETLMVQVKQILERAWNEGQLDDLDTIYAPTVVRHEPPNADIVGLAALKQYIIAMRTAFPDLILRLHESIRAGTIGAGRWSFQGTHTGPLPGLTVPPTGRHVKFDGLFFVHTSEDKAIEEWVYGDNMGMLQQLGLLPPVEP